MKRFERDRMSGKDFAAALAHLEMKPGAFARIFGAEIKRVDEWISGKEPVPHWVPVVVDLLQMPGALGRARQVAAEMILRDNLRGEDAPYLEKDETS